MMDLERVYARLVSQGLLRQDDSVAVLAELERLRKLSAYLASCHAATLESLPKGASKTLRMRLAAICGAAAKGLTGDMSGIGLSVSMLDAARRCEVAGRTLGAGEAGQARKG